jgi:hypothetical protein
MSITTYNTTYFDDLSVKDLNQKTPLDKNYLRILFKPGYSVQVRELNQLQSILQTQVDRLGSSVYREGVAVTGGNCTFDVNIKTVDIELNTNYDESRLATVEHLKDNLGLIAYVYDYEILVEEGVQTRFVRFYLRYNNSIQTGEASENVSIFPSEYIGNTSEAITNSVLEYDADLLDTDQTIGIVYGVGYCAGLFLSEGIFFIKGSFVHTPKQRRFFSYSLEEETVKSQINGYAYLSYSEFVTNYTSDSTLLDNANGTPNYSAPGADRYTIDLTLNFGDLTSNLDSNSFKLLTISNSLVLDTLKEKYSDLDRTFARRTHEESGNYVVDNFDITVQECYNDGTNGGRYRYTPEYNEIPSDIYTDIDQPEDIINKAKDLYSVSLDPGIAYVSGYRIESVDKAELYRSKARGTSHISQTINISSSASLGTYVIGTLDNLSSLPVVQNAALRYNLEKTGSPNTVIGSCKIRAIEPTSTTGNYALFLYDIVLTGPNRFSDTVKIVKTDAGFGFTLTNAGTIYDANQSNAFFAIPYSTVENVSELEYYVLRTVTSLSNSFTLTAPDETFADSSGTIVRLADNTVTTLSGVLDNGAKTITFSPPASSVTSACLKIKIKSSNTNTRLKTKTKTTAEDTISTAVSGTTANSLYKMVHSDIVRIIEVRTGSNAGTDITQYCNLVFDGQLSTHYTNAYLAYNGPSRSSAAIWVRYEYLNHSATGDYFTVNSYSSLDYSEIPSYAGIRLSDVYDFRPLILDGVTNTTIVPIDPNSVFEANVKYYLPRIDSVIVTAAGEFDILTGEPTLNPVPPETPRGAMLMYGLTIPAYTFSASDITLKRISNKRYTMRDIENIETRVNNLEYYTSLSLLERDSMERRILDPSSNTDRFKNGIIVDSFYDHSVGEVTNPAYLCAVDTTNGGLSPKQLAKSVPVRIISSENLRQHAHGITLDYEELPLISQLYASETISVNPYDVAIFTGGISLLPSTDDWKDTIRLPDVQINDTGAYDAMVIASQQNKNMFGTTYSEWTTNWTGIPYVSWVSDFQRGEITAGSFAATVLGGKVGTIGFLGRQQDITQTGEATRTAITTSLGSVTEVKSLGDRIVDSSYIPYMRSRKVYFTGNGLLPNTKVYAFFDNIDITEYCNQLNGIPALNIEKINDSPGLYTNVLSDNIEFFKKQPLITDNTGKIYGEFIIPNNTILKFKTGERVFRLTSSPRNITAEAETIANGNYSASGTTITVEETILSIKKPVVNTTTSEERKQDSKTTRVWFDPVAQTFLIPEITEGVYATSVDIFFSQKSSNLPVTLQIVTVENGIPTQKIVPFSRVILDADQVSIDPNLGAAATNFKFSDPVYLKHGVEYALVLLSNDSAYRMWIASTGGINVKDKSFISKNVYGGVLLTSQNASTWTPDQSKDLKFVLNRADFNLTGSVTHRSSLQGRLFSVSVTNGGTGYTSAPIVTIAPPGVTATATAVVINGGVSSFVNVTGGSNYTSAPFVTIAAPTGTGNKRQAQAVAFINSSGTIFKISTSIADGGDPGLGYTTAPTVVIDPPGVTATAVATINPIDNSIGAINVTLEGSNYSSAPTVTIAAPNDTNGVTATATSQIENVIFSGFNLNQTALIPVKTSLTNSIVNSGIIYENVQLNTNYTLKSEYDITTTDQIEVTNVLSTTSPYVSPMLDLERKSIICFRNEINNIFTTETSSDAGGAIARYITKKIILKNSSNQLNIYLDVNRPSSTTNIKLYVKFDDSSSWLEFNPLQTIPATGNQLQYSEAQYVVSDTDKLFTSFAIKIVMISDNPAMVPKIRDLRAIATVG